MSKKEKIKQLLEEISDMSAEDILQLLIEIKQEKGLLPEDSEKLVFHGKLIDLQNAITLYGHLNLIGTWRLSNCSRFTQLILKEYKNNINFYKTGTILIQGDESNFERLKKSLKEVISKF